MADDSNFKGRCLCLTISVIVHEMATCHSLRLRNKEYSDALGSFLSEGNCHFTAHLHATQHFHREEMSSLMHFVVIVECLA